jgi:hypothetical protein
MPSGRAPYLFITGSKRDDCCHCPGPIAGIRWRHPSARPCRRIAPLLLGAASHTSAPNTIGPNKFHGDLIKLSIFIEILQTWDGSNEIHENLN